MDWLKAILFPDKYEHGLSAKYEIFTGEGTYHAMTTQGYVFSYNLICQYRKVKHDEFKKHQMLEKGAEEKFLDELHRTVVLPAMRAKGRFFTFQAGTALFPTLCRPEKENGEEYIFRDNACLELIEEIRATPFAKFGCDLVFSRFTSQLLSEDLIISNYNKMIKLYPTTAIQNQPEYRAAEEAVVIAFAHREIQLRKIFQQAQEHQVNKGTNFSVESQMVRNTLELKWSLKHDLSRTQTLRGYRREGGFWTGQMPLENNGTCIVDARADGRVAQNLTEGQNTFFTFVLLDSINDKESILETMRFSVRSLPEGERRHLEELQNKIVAKDEQVPEVKDPKRLKLDNAMHELLSFVEFDESISQIEKELVARIRSNDYTAEEREEKIERLKVVVESLRIENM